MFEIDRFIAAAGSPARSARDFHEAKSAVVAPHAFGSRVPASSMPP
jgi:hypothetical protein